MLKPIWALIWWSTRLSEYSKSCSLGSTIESYLQEAGRIGRDRLSSMTTLFLSKTDLRADHISNEMKGYCRNADRCHRGVLVSEDGENQSLSNCCNVCIEKNSYNLLIHSIVYYTY